MLSDYDSDDGDGVSGEHADGKNSEPVDVTDALKACTAALENTSVPGDAFDALVQVCTCAASTNPDYRPQIVMEGGVLVLTQAALSEDNNVCRVALCTLGHLANTPAHRSVIARSEHLIPCLKENASSLDMALRHQALRCLARLASKHVDNQEILARSGVIPSLVASVDADDLRVQQQAVYALWNVSETPTLRPLILSEAPDIVDQVAEAIRERGFAAEVTMTLMLAVGLLWNLSEGSQVVRQQAQSHGLVSLMIELLFADSALVEAISPFEEPVWLAQFNGCCSVLSLINGDVYFRKWQEDPAVYDDTAIEHQGRGRARTMNVAFSRATSGALDEMQQPLPSTQPQQ
eukprot:m.445235 g.445235  ORF g.445235 m.445235 type:complete len:348 (+) comp20301_c3_seq4:191-1234(+)